MKTAAQVDASPLRWTPWTPLDGAPKLSASTLAELLDGGQSFRWNREPDGAWFGLWADQVARLRVAPDGALEYSAPSASSAAGRAAAELRAYLFSHDAPAQVNALPWRSDPHLARCIAAFPGLAILHQPLSETLLGFLCSSTKQIVQIKRMIALLAERHGAKLAGPHRRLPTWAELAQVSEAELRLCQLGFRAGYVHQTARFLEKRPGWLEATAALPYADAKTRLCELPGVGEKVADCVLLFGAGKLDAFPVDTWIIKTMSRRYGLEGWSPAQIAHFGRAHFGPHAGLAQQYLFAYERAARKT